MGRTYKNAALYVLLSLLIAVACAPLNVFGPAVNTPAPAVPSSDVEVASVVQAQVTSTVVVPSSTATTVFQPATLSPSFSELYAFIQAPEGPVAVPFVTLIAFQSVPDVSFEIRGTLDSRTFVCSGSPCMVPVPTSSIIVFSAVSSTGASSEDVSATIRVELGSDGYYVFIDTVSQFSAFSDSCLRFWRFQDDTDPTWAEFVQFPYLLNTDKTLHYLVTRLIIHGIVDVQGCPAGGLSLGLDWPTGCGLERARDAMIGWQNQFDEYIWLASKNHGIPPKILKTIIEVESQFWPGNERFYVDEIGLGQLNQLGVDVLLRRNPTLYQQVCSTVLDDCALPYALMSAQNQAMIRGAFVSSFSSDCPSCEYGLDLNKAKESVSFIAQVLHANCETVKIIADSKRQFDYIEDLDDPYSDFWRFTLFAYHSGISCFEQAVKNTPNGIPLTWENLAENIECAGGESYVDGVWGNLLSFDQNLYGPSGQEIRQVAPVFAATRTPFPTAVLSTAQVIVQTFLDSNQNGIMDASEGLDNITVVLQSVDGTVVSGNTVNGQVSLPLAEFQIGGEITVNLPQYYRSENIVVPAQGTVPVLFSFSQPTLPTVIP
jgi:hypothetical protein